MRPVRLTFAGLRSYRSETTVDFESLDLFAVIGDTGAGKSTRIEALCLALYGKRSWTGGSARMEDMITDGVTTMRIELTFRAAGHDWTVTRARHRNNAAPIDRLVSPTGGVGADGARQVSDRIAEVVGLNFDQFTRAVVLPQGRFDALLRASETERNGILSSILDLGDVAATKARVEALRKEWDPKVVEWSTLRGQLPADTAAAVTQAESAAGDAVDLDDRLRSAVEQAAAIESQISGATAEREALRAALAAVPSPAPDDIVATLRQAADRWAALDADVARVTSEREQTDALVGELTGARSSLLRGAPSRDALVAAATEARAVNAELPEAAAEFDAAEVAMAAVGPAPSTTDVDPAALVAVQAAASEVAAAEDRRRHADEQVSAARHAVAAWSEAHAAVRGAAEAVETFDARLATGADVVAGSEAELDDAAAAFDAAQSAELAALRADAAATAAEGCAPGAPCPVCARPLPDEFIPPGSAHDVDAAGARRRSAAERVRAATELLARHRGQLDKLEGERAAAVASLESARRSLSAAAARATAVGVAVDALDVTVASGAAGQRDVIDEAAALGAVVVEAAEAAVAVDRARRSHAEALAAQQRAEAERHAAIASHARELESASGRRAQACARLVRLAARLASLPGDWAQVVDPSTSPSPSDPPDPPDLRPELVAQLAGELAGAVEQLGEIEARLRAAEHAVRDLAGRVDELARQAVDEVHRPATAALDAADGLLRAVDRVAALLRGDAPGGTGGSGASSVYTEPLDAPHDHEALRVATDHLESRLSAASTVLQRAAQWQSELDAATSEAQRTLADLVTAHGGTTVGDLRERRGAAGTARRIAEDALVAARVDAATAAELDERLGVAAPFVANLAVLDVALRSQHFVAHLVDARERELLAEASRRLKDITGGRFGFVADFGIVDVRSGEVRSPDTLSGGERFQAALALALALVEIASRGAGKLDAVFVDEGFGSLDHQALDVALATLGNVAGGGKMVALISHLRPVAEFVDDVLLVTKDEMHGSRIELLDADARDDMLADDIRSGLTA